MSATPLPPLEPDSVLAALGHVLDPEFGISIVDLGLIYDVAIADDCLAITMTLTSMHCPAGDIIVNGARAAAACLAGGRRIEVRLVWDPPWSPEMLSPAARKQLGWRSRSDA
jgi:metal-sulfur cluster biosynthetic enzyme